MELVIEQLRQVGIRRVNVTTHYKLEKILDHFGDGSAYGLSQETPSGYDERSASILNARA